MILIDCIQTTVQQKKKKKKIRFLPDTLYQVKICKGKNMQLLYKIIKYYYKIFKLNHGR